MQPNEQSLCYSGSVWEENSLRLIPEQYVNSPHWAIGKLNPPHARHTSEELRQRRLSALALIIGG